MRVEKTNGEKRQWLGISPREEMRLTVKKKKKVWLNNFSSIKNLNHPSANIYIVPCSLWIFPFHLLKFTNIMAPTEWNYCKKIHEVCMNLFEWMFEPYARALRATEHLQGSRAERLSASRELHVPWKHTCLFCLGITWLGTETPLSTWRNCAGNRTMPRLLTSLVVIMRGLF